MASRKALLMATATMAVVVVGALLPATASAARLYRIGDDHGWSPGVDYKAWASSKTFYVFDVFEFVYDANLHNLVIVDWDSYAACRVLPSGSQTMNGGIDHYVFKGPGTYYFICSIDDHCQSGMRLAVKVKRPQ